MGKRTIVVVRGRACELEVTKPFGDCYDWLPAEEEILRKYYPIEGYKCHERIQNHTLASCKCKINALKLRKNTFLWSDEEDNIIRKYYPEGGAEACLKYIPDRSKARIMGRAAFLNVKSSHRYKKGQRIICVETGEIFDSAAEAGRKYNCSMIAYAANGQQKTAAGYHWRYVDEKEIDKDCL